MPVAWRSGFEAIGERHVMMRPRAALCATSPIKATASGQTCQGYGYHDILGYNIDSGYTMESMNIYEI